MTAMLRTCLAGIVAASLVGCADTDSDAPTESAETAATSQHETRAPALAQEAGDTLDRTGLECYKLLAHGGDFKSKYKVGNAKDKYLNFTFKAPWTGTAYGIVFNPVIDNKKVLHHWLLFQTPATNAVGISGSSGAHPAGALLSGWAPGGEPVDFRTLADTQVGLELSGNNTYTIEFHYNSSDAAALDSSGVEICVQKEKPKEIAGLSWLGYDQLGIAAKEWTGTCKPKAQQKINIIGVVPHMHKTGTHIKGIINRADGTKETLIDKPFDFDYQIQYRTPAVLNPGDSVTTTCTFDKPMAFGESTTAEMCYMFTLSWPRGLLTDNGPWGTLAHGAGACLGQ